MHRRRFLIALALGTLTAGALAACGSPAPASPTAAPAASGATAAKPASGSASADIPMFAEAKPLAADSPMATAVDAMKQQLKQQPDANLTVDAYVLPASATFDQVKKFYGDEMTKRGWKTIDMPQQANAGIPGGGSAAWLKDEKEILTVMVMTNPSGGSFLLVSHGTKK
jgi:hypothetical protein